MIENKLNWKFYSGEDKYTDGEIENQILNIVNSNEDYREVLAKNNDWAILYHLSEVRENLLEWFDFDNDGTLLEIGSGCGAMTGLFCKKLRRVVGIELSKKRSLINITRNKQYENLEVFVGNFENINIEEKFDYVTLIGVLEYAISYINGENPFETMTKIRNAGAIFLGEYSSEPLGDYFAGPNHVLPTNGTAKFFSPLSVDDFIKKSSIINYSREALQAVYKDIVDFAEAEQLTAHANSIRVRFED